MQCHRVRGLHGPPTASHVQALRHIFLLLVKNLRADGRRGGGAVGKAGNGWTSARAQQHGRRGASHTRLTHAVPQTGACRCAACSLTDHCGASCCTVQPMQQRMQQGNTRRPRPAPAPTFSLAFLKSSCVTHMRRSRSASSPASVHIALMSAPLSSSCVGCEVRSWGQCGGRGQCCQGAWGVLRV